MLFRNRRYMCGTTPWSFWLWQEIDGFLTRLFLVKTPWFAICLHWIVGADRDPFPHDHPRSFVSLLLKGSYSEWRRRRDETDFRVRRRRWLNVVSAHPNDQHQITQVSPGGVLTLCLMGRKAREWGYHADDGSWVFWQDFQTASAISAENWHLFYVPTLTDKHNRL